MFSHARPRVGGFGMLLVCFLYEFSMNWACFLYVFGNDLLMALGCFWECF